MPSRPDTVRGTGPARAFLRRAALLLPTAALAGALAFSSSGPALADPALTVDQAKAQIEQLQMDAAALDQQWDGIQVKITQTEQDLKQRKADLAAQTAKVATLRTQLGQLALAEFQNRNLDTRAQLFVTQDPEGFLSQMSTVEKVSQNQNASLQQFQAEQAVLTDLQQGEAADLAGLQADKQQLASVRKASQAKITQAQAVLDKLTAEQQRKLAAERAKQEAASRQAAADAIAGNAEGGAGASGTQAATEIPAGSGKGEQALKFALSQIGKPYVFGATGPNAYDCSGLTLAAWKSAGVSLDRTSQAQWHDGVSVPLSQLQPGDLVFFYNSTAPTHVAIYLGDGKVVHAPHPGASVEIINMNYMDPVGARRPG